MSHDGVTIEPPEDLGDPTRELDKEDFKSNHVDLTMGPEILQLWRSLNFKPHFALAEFIDNSISSWQQCKDRDPNFPALEVKIRISALGHPVKGTFIRITDNAGGITDEDLRNRALRIGAAPPNKTYLNQYGAGMKIAACWFSDVWEIRTRSLEEGYEKHLQWDTPELMKKGLDLSWDTEEADYHGTEITLWNPRTLFPNNSQSVLKNHLSNIYRHFLRDGSLKLIVESDANRYELKATDTKILEKPFWTSVGKRPESDSPSILWKKNFEEELAMNEEGEPIAVRGWLGIRETGRTAEAGLMLYWKNRGVKGVGHEGAWKPFEVFGGGNSFESQRLTGEIHITGIKKPPTTDDLLLYVDGVNVEDLLIERINTLLDDPEFPMRKQINNYRKNADIKLEEEWEDSADLTSAQVLEDVVKAVNPEGLGEALSESIELSGPASDVAELSMPKDQGSLESRKLQKVSWLGRQWNVSIEHLLGDPGKLWVDAAMSPTEYAEARIQIRLNLSHPFMVQQVGEDSTDVQPFTRMAIALGLVSSVAKQDPTTRDPQLLPRIDKLLRELAN